MYVTRRLPSSFPCAVLIVQHTSTFPGPAANRLVELRPCQFASQTRRKPSKPASTARPAASRLRQAADHVAIVLTDEDPLWGGRPDAGRLLSDVARYVGPVIMALC